MATGNCENIGVLLVHGIGAQKPNEHLIGEAHRIVAALGEDEQIVAINVIEEPSIAKDIPHKFQSNLPQNTVRVDATCASGKRFRFEFNEVYWAELSEASSIARQVTFWFWALSMWSVAGRESSILEGFKKMYIPKGDGFRAVYRLQLGFLGGLFLLGAGTVGIWNMIAGRLKLPRVYISTLLTDYVGDVMLYGQPRRDSEQTVGELGEPPRAKIRGRMVDAMTEFALRDYDRWYVVAHSLGTVVAYNGLMETEEALPNYLSQARWEEVKAQKPGLVANLDGRRPELMLPRRPTWLADSDGIDRRVLFAKLQGFVTYGPAIGKFHGIWPIMVPCNRDEFVFQEKFKWVNIYDQLDPVSGPLLGYTTKFFGPWKEDEKDKSLGTQTEGKDLTFTDKNRKTWSAAKITASISYSAGKVWLLSHLGYLTHPSAAYDQRGYAVFSLAKWLRTGEYPADEFNALDVGIAGGAWRSLVAQLQLIAIAVAVWLVAARLSWEVVPQKYLTQFIDKDWIPCAFATFMAAFVVNYFIEVFAKIPPPPRWARLLFVVGAFAGAYTLKEVFEADFKLMIAAASALVVGMIAATVIDSFYRWRPKLWTSAQAVHRSVVAVGLVAAAGAGYLLYSPGSRCLGDLQAFLSSHLRGHDLRIFALDLLSLTVILIVVLGMLRWLFQPIPVKK